MGLFVAVLLVAAYGVHRFIARERAGGEDGLRVYALLGDASGIAPLSRVKIAGISVGKVAGVRLEGDRARIDLELDPGVVLHEDATLAKVSTSLLGQYYLALTPGAEGAPELEDGARIRTVTDAVTTDALLQDMVGIAGDVKRITASLAESIGTPQGQEYLQETMKSLAEVTIALNATVRENREAIRAIIANIETLTATGRPDVLAILGDLRAITGDARALLAKEGAAAPGEVRQIVERVGTASASLDRALQNVDAVSGKLARGEGTLGKLVSDDELGKDLYEAAEDVSDFLSEMRRLQTIVELRSDYEFLTSTVKSYISMRLQPREDKYYLLGLVNDPRGLTKVEQTVVQTDNPEDPPQYREVRTMTTNDLRFTAQFAQVFGAFTGRFGIMESTGGLGLDIDLFNDRLELKQDLFGFGELVRPEWRMSLGYEFLTRLWLLGGAEDVLAVQDRDYFVGLQLRFNDRDLKSLLPFAPSVK